MTSPLPNLRKGLVACLSACLWLLSSCGGGAGGQASNTGNGGGIGSGGTGSYTNGPISGLGSIIVNSVRYEVGQAQVISDDDLLTANPAPHTADDLKLGMQVEVSGGTLAAGLHGALATAAAGQVRFASALLGPVDTAYDSACTCLYVLGQKVLVGATTVWPKDLQAGNVVEVYGQPDLTQAGHQLVATRVQRVTDGTRPFKLVGWVSADDLAASTVTVHGPTSNLTLSYSLPSQVSALDGLGSHGQRVRVWMQRGLDVQQHHALVKVVVDETLVSDQDEARLEGLVTVAADAGRMSINGQVVDVSAVLASVSGLTVGQRVRVDGSLVDGVLKVTEVYVGGGDGGEDDDSGIELHGRPTAFGAVDGDATHATMLVRGVTVLYALSLAPSNLQGLACVEVEGSGFNAADQLIASAVKADDSCH